MDLREVGCNAGDCRTTDLAQDRVQWQTYVRIMTSGFLTIQLVSYVNMKFMKLLENPGKVLNVLEYCGRLCMGHSRML